MIKIDEIKQKNRTKKAVLKEKNETEKSRVREEMTEQVIKAQETMSAALQEQTSHGDQEALKANNEALS